MLEEVDLFLSNQIIKLFKCTFGVSLPHCFPVYFLDCVLWGGQDRLFVTVFFEFFPYVLDGSSYVFESSGRGLLVGFP